jgi:hypothetical protein
VIAGEPERKLKTKWLLGSLAGLIVLVVGGSVISNMIEESALKDQQAHTEFVEQSTKLNDKLKAAKVRAVELRIGPVAAKTLNACYGYGYPESPNLVEKGLSSSRIAECDGILKNLDKDEARSKR